MANIYRTAEGRRQPGHYSGSRCAVAGLPQEVYR